MFHCYAPFLSLHSGITASTPCGTRAAFVGAFFAWRFLKKFLIANELELAPVSSSLIAHWILFAGAVACLSWAVPVACFSSLFVSL